MNEIKDLIKKKLNTNIVNEIETDEALAFEVRIQKKVFTFYNKKDESLKNQLMAFIYRIERILR